MAFRSRTLFTCGEADRSRHGKCCSSSSCCCCCCMGDHFHFTSLMYTQKGCEKKNLCQKIGAKKENFFQSSRCEKGKLFLKGVQGKNIFSTIAVSRKETRFVTHKRRRSVKGSLSCSAFGPGTERRHLISIIHVQNTLAAFLKFQTAFLLRRKCGYKKMSFVVSLTPASLLSTCIV